ncbi:MAG: hypothetical protein KDD81_07695 [Rhodobacteraceae bacterium]|nr:hypothetical protein [Paracoccaceae bacterium]
MRPLFFSAAAIFAFAAFPAVSAPDFKIPVTDRFSLEDLTWQGEGRSYEFLWDVALHKGTIIVCGLGRFVSPHGRSQTASLLRKATVYLNDKAILRDITFFTLVKADQPLEKQMATCRDTGVAPASRSDKVRLDIRGVGRF